MVVVVKVVVRENENVGGVPSQKKYIGFTLGFPFWRERPGRRQERDAWDMETLFDRRREQHGRDRL